MRGWCVVLALGGCVDDDGGAPPPILADTDGLGTGSTSSSEDGGGDPPTPDAGVPMIWPRDISIVALEANQGVPIPLYEDGVAIPPRERNARIVAGRDLLVRAYWKLDPDYVPRKIEAVVLLEDERGDVQEVSSVQKPQGPSRADDLSQTFSIAIPPELVQPNLEISVELREHNEVKAVAGPIPNRVPEEPVKLAAKQGPRELRVLLVPIKHELGAGCPEAPFPNEDTLWKYWVNLHGQNPTDTTIIDVRSGPPLPWTESLTDLWPLLERLALLRGEDAADPGVYYYGIVRPCDGGPPDYDGMAIATPNWPRPGNAWMRTSAGVIYDDPWYDGELMVHEIGHGQGRWHVTCTGDELEPDNAYPYEDARLGGIGWSPGDGWISNRNTRDFMSYCNDQWVSDYGWEYVFDSIREITSWGMQAPPSGRLLLGSVTDDGRRSWIVVRGEMDRMPTADHVLELATPDGTIEVPVAIEPRPDSTSTTMVAALPDVPIEALTLTTPTARHEIPLAVLTR